MGYFIPVFLQVSDISLICSLSITASSSTFFRHRALSQFVCLFIEDSFDEFLTGFKSGMLAKCKQLSEEFVQKVANVVTHLKLAAADMGLGPPEKMIRILDSMLTKADEVVSILVLELPPVVTMMMVMVTMMVIRYKDVMPPSPQKTRQKK